MYLTMKSSLSHSCYNVFEPEIEPEIPATLTDDVIYRYEIYIIIFLVSCTPDYNVTLSLNNIKLSILQKENV